jgi:hypothetical protein
MSPPGERSRTRGGRNAREPTDLGPAHRPAVAWSGLATLAATTWWPVPAATAAEAPLGALDSPEALQPADPSHDVIRSLLLGVTPREVIQWCPTEHGRGEGDQLVTKKNGSGIDFPWALIVVFLLAVWAASLAIPRHIMVFHWGPRWIGDNMSEGIPVLCGFAIFTAFIMYRWHTRDQRKLARLSAARLWAERTQPRIQRELEQKRQTAELKRQAADLKKQVADLKRQAAESKRNAKREEVELRKQEAERWKREIREAITREEGLRGGGPA